jgi:hypothetical protein
MLGSAPSISAGWVPSAPVAQAALRRRPRRHHEEVRPNLGPINESPTLSRTPLEPSRASGWA